MNNKCDDNKVPPLVVVLGLDDEGKPHASRFAPTTGPSDQLERMSPHLSAWRQQKGA